MQTRYKPERTQFSLLIVIILLAFAVTHVLNPKPQTVAFDLLGFLVRFDLDLGLGVTLLCAVVAAAGVDWLLRSHPSIQPGETLEHWLLPMLTVMILGITLNMLPGGPSWWLGFGMGALLLVLVFSSEFIAVDPGDLRFPLASAALTTLSFGLFLMFTIVMHANSTRLFLLLPALLLTGSLIALRTLHLRLSEHWELTWAVGIGLMVTQLGAALHYYPLTSIRFGLLLTGPLYALTLLAVSLIEGNPFRRAMVEPLLMLALFGGLTVLFR